MKSNIVLVVLFLWGPFSWAENYRCYFDFYSCYQNCKVADVKSADPAPTSLVLQQLRFARLSSGVFEKRKLPYSGSDQFEKYSISPHPHTRTGWIRIAVDRKDSDHRFADFDSKIHILVATLEWDGEEADQQFFLCEKN